MTSDSQITEAAEAEVCELCGDEDHPAWLDDDAVSPDCDRAVSRRGYPKITYMTEEAAQEAVDLMMDEVETRPYYYECRWLLRCANYWASEGCGREFPGTEHYHVTSG